MLASNVVFALKTQIMRSQGSVSFKGKDGYSMVANNVEVSLRDRTMRSFGPVKGRTNVGPFSGNSMSADLDARTVRLTGNARLRIEGNALR